MTDVHDIGMTNDDFNMVEQDDFVEIRSSTSRRAVSSGEPSLDGSLDVDEERGALSDSDINHAARADTLASQVRGPSSDALEEECRHEALERCRLSRDEWEKVLGNDRLLKKVTTNGVGSTKPVDGQYVTLKVVDTLRGTDSHERLTFLLGYSMVIDAWEICVKLMTEGEVSAVKTVADLAYGEHGLDENVPPNQDMEYTLELISIEEGPRVQEMSQDELGDLVLSIKDRGNFYFARAEYQKAIFVYKRASAIIPEVADDNEALRKLFSALHSNLAVCYYKMGELDLVLPATEESLRLHGANTKALFRRAEALVRRNEVDEAMECLNKAIEFEPNDLTIRAELERLSGLKEKNKIDERKLYKKMIAGAGDFNNGRGGYWTALGGQRHVLMSFFVVMSAMFVYLLFVELDVLGLRDNHLHISA